MDIKTTISSTEARQNFAEVIENVSNAGVRYTLTVNGKPKVIIVNAEEYDSWAETMDILSDPRMINKVRRAEKQLDRGEAVTLEELKVSLK